jgi:hypothetical protein
LGGAYLHTLNRRIDQVHSLLNELQSAGGTPSFRRPAIRRAIVGSAAAVALLSATLGTAYALTLGTGTGSRAGTPDTLVGAPTSPATPPVPTTPTATATPATIVRKANAATPPKTALPPTVNPSSPAPASPPPTFVAIRDGRVAVLSTVSGRVLRFLTAAGPMGAGGRPAVDSRRQTVYLTGTTGTCNAPLVAVPYAGGRTQVVDRSPGRHLWPTVDRGHRIAYLSYPCTEEDRDVVTVRDLRNGHVHSIAIPSGTEVHSMAWVQNRPLLAVVVWRLDLPERPAELRLLDVYRSHTVHDGRLVTAADGCVFTQVARRGSRPELAAAEICFIEGRRFQRLVDVDAVAGVRSRVHTTLPTGHDFITSLDVDGSGRHVIYMGMSVNGGPSTYILKDGTPRRLATDLAFPSW